MADRKITHLLGRKSNFHVVQSIEMADISFLN